MDMVKNCRRIIWIFAGILTLWVVIYMVMSHMPVKLKGAWDINDGEEIIVFYDNDICTCDGDAMIYRILDNNTISLDGEVFEFEITDKKNKKMMLDEKD